LVAAALAGNANDRASAATTNGVSNVFMCISFITLQ
jgi:hypothetical protein